MNETVIYKLKNPYCSTIDKLCDQLAEKICDRVRASTTEVPAIAKNTGFKIQNIENCKQYVFLDEYTLERSPEYIERKRFHANIHQFLTWQRLYLYLKILK